MEGIVQFLVRNSYLVLFACVVLEQGGLPIPAVPVLLAAGALAGAGRMNLALILGLAVLASLVSDVTWYAVGRQRGLRVLQLLCRISLEPDSCVRQTEDLFSRRGIASLLVAKFVPGLSTVAPPLAGITRMPLSRFVLFDGLGALLWVGVFVALGVLFSEELEGMAVLLATMGSWLFTILAGGLGAYLIWKFVARRRLRLARITPEELHHKLGTGNEVIIVDLRHPLELEADPVIIPGAIRVSAEDVEQHRFSVPQGREVILYCT